MRKNSRGDALIIANYAAALTEELVLIELADVCAMVFEITQHRFMKGLEAVKRDREQWLPKTERAIVQTQQILEEKARSVRDSLR